MIFVIMAIIESVLMILNVSVFIENMIFKNIHINYDQCHVLTQQ